LILEIDAGNTRIKWRIIDPQRATDHSVSGSVLAAADCGALMDDLAKQLDETSMAGVTRVRVSSVRGEEFAKFLAALLQKDWRLEPEFARVEKQRSGVTNAYGNIDSMGVDRWLAMLAAYDRAGGECCILDCGSAMTFDWLNSAGRHQGGYIVPGINMMLDSLIRTSPALSVTPSDGVPEPGNSTASAICNGLVAMALGFADHCHRMVAAENDGIEWYLTGGDAGKLSPHLAWPHTLVSDLVLDGLALALP
jgi:type III pantothenate kinase